MNEGLNLKFVEKIITFQGEGPDAGRRCLLLRFKHCNKFCSWCDTRQKITTYSESIIYIEEIQRILHDEECGLLITGGEPTYYKKDVHNQLEGTLTLLNNLKYSFANVETNGFALQELMAEIYTPEYVKVIYSPKVFTLEDLETTKQNLTAVGHLQNLFIKVVIDFENLDLLTKLFEFLYTTSLTNKVYVMPIGATKEEIIMNSSYAIRLANRYKFNFSSRDHLIYNFA